MNRNTLFGSTFLRSPAEDPGGAGAPAAPEPVITDPATSVAELAPVIPAAEPAPAPDPKPEAAPAEPTKADTVEPKVEVPAKPPEPSTLLSDAVKAEKPEGAKPDAKPEVPKPSDQVPDAAAAPAVPPAYNFTMPEGAKVDQAAMGAYTEVLGKHGIAPEVGQALLDQHVAVMNKYAEHVASEQQRVWQETNAKWREEAKGDAEIGGAAFETSMKAAARMLELVVKPEEMTAVNQMLEMTGAGNHPLLLKMMVRFAKWLDEPAPPAVQGQPAPTNGKAPGRQRFRDIYAANEAARKAT